MAKRQPELYRTPRKPGYLGSYDWRATALGCLLLVIANFVATQYIASKFQYSLRLGRLFYGRNLAASMSLSLGLPGDGAIAPRAMNGFGSHSSRAK